MSHVTDRSAEIPLLSLLRTAAAGDPRDQEALLAALHVPIRRYLAARMARTRDPSDLADDLAQDTLIHMLGRLPQCGARSDAQVVPTRSRSHVPVSLTISAAHEPVRRQRRPTVRSPRNRRPAGRPTNSSLASFGMCSHGSHVRQPNWSAFEVLEGRTWPEVAIEMRTTTTAAKRRFQRAQARLRRALHEAVAALPEREREAVRLRLRLRSTD